jgi:hypothetical protein
MKVMVRLTYRSAVSVQLVYRGMVPDQSDGINSPIYHQIPPVERQASSHAPVRYLMSGPGSNQRHVQVDTIYLLSCLPPDSNLPSAMPY